MPVLSILDGIEDGLDFVHIDLDYFCGESPQRQSLNDSVPAQNAAQHVECPERDCIFGAADAEASNKPFQSRAVLNRG